MKQKHERIAAALLAGVLCAAALTACSSPKPASSQPPASSQTASTGGQETPPETSQNTSYDFPALGLSANFPEELIDRMEQEELVCFSRDFPTEDGAALQYGILSWHTMTEEQRQTETVSLDSLECVGALGVYQAGMEDQLDELTGCDQHQELGQSADGAYRYYLSTSSTADEELTGMIRQIQITITEMSKYQAPDNSGGPQSASSVTSLGEFTTQDINGNTFTQDMFQDYDLTMVNVFTTWCSPCVAEIPDLEKLYQQMAGQGVNIVGVVLDVLDEKAEIDQDSLERAKLLAEQTGATYPILLPDAGYFNGRLIGIEAVPETFFVDRNGNIVGETYSGSGSFEDWLEVVEQTLAGLQEGA